MSRRFVAVILGVLALAWGSPTYACGDKFLRLGRSSRIRAYASVHPSPILVYAPRWTRRGIADFEKMLSRAGHTPLTVTSERAISQAMSAGSYAVVIAVHTDARAIKPALDLLPSRPALLPVVYKATKAEAAEARAAYQCVLNPESMTTFQALEEIDRLIDLKLKNAHTLTAPK
jgi:hypothetical protein